MTNDIIDTAVSDACRDIRQTLLAMDARLRGQGVYVSITINRHDGNDWAVLAAVDVPEGSIQ